MKTSKLTKQNLFFFFERVFLYSLLAILLVNNLIEVKEQKKIRSNVDSIKDEILFKNSLVNFKQNTFLTASK